MSELRTGNVTITNLATNVDSSVDVNVMSLVMLQMDFVSRDVQTVSGVQTVNYQVNVITMVIVANTMEPNQLFVNQSSVKNGPTGGTITADLSAILNLGVAPLLTGITVI